MAGIYVHIPFCRKLCSYCDFYHVIRPEDYSSFTGALISEMKIRSSYLGSEPVSTIYFGGGTPSVLNKEDLAGMLNGIRQNYNVSGECEITLEVNPDDIDASYPVIAKELGFNRVSIGIQSWRDEDLRLMNRRHNSIQAESALEHIFSAGFENVSADLIYGTPGMPAAEWRANLDKMFSFPVRHLSAYHLTIEKGTVFGKMKEKNLISEIDEEESNLLFNILIERAGESGFVQYEISNFAREGYFSVHNSNYWKQVNYIGLGPSAHSFNGFSRQWNVRNLKRYIKSVNEGMPEHEKEELTPRIRFNEYVMTSLRTMWGIDLDYVEKAFEKEGYDYVVNTSAKFIEYGLIKSDKKTLVLTNQGKMISDNIISEFMMPEND